MPSSFLFLSRWMNSCHHPVYVEGARVCVCNSSSLCNDADEFLVRAWQIFKKYIPVFPFVGMQKYFFV